MNSMITPDNFEFFARYFLAGWIIIAIRSRYVIGERPKLAEMIAEAVVLSLINQLAFAGLFAIFAWFAQHLANLSPLPRLFFFIEIIVLPGVLGLVFGWNLSKGWNQALLRRLAMPVQNPIRRAYDVAFDELLSEGFVILTYTDGTKIYGYFGENSLAASDPARSDLYLERLYDVVSTISGTRRRLRAVRYCCSTECAR